MYIESIKNSAQVMLHGYRQFFLTNLPYDISQIVEDCAVNDILINENIFGTREVTGVSTSKGVIITDCVVNCAGT